MSRRRAPLSPAKRRQARVVLALATTVAATGTIVDVAGGHGVWVTGIVGWAAVVAAVWLGVGGEHAPDIVGLGPVAARWRRRWDERSGPRNDADWS